VLIRLSEEKVFKDPVHRSIYVQDATVWRLIDTPEFQRLRRIRQLGTSYLTFHGAEHSRFSHSLGVYEIARRIINQFDRGGYGGWTDEEKLLGLCAALLHDVGHGPFSHSLERVFGTSHEHWTCAIITGDTAIRRVLEEVSPDFPERIVAVIRKTGAHPVVVNLVSSQLDADRMDYLLRDAYFAGVHYGTFDLDRILRVLRPYEGRIVVKESGMHAVEDYLLSRYQMYWQVYFHPVTRSSEILLRLIFRRAHELYREGYRFGFLLPPLRQLFEGNLDVAGYLALDEAMVQTAFAQWMSERDGLLADLCSRFLHRRLYQYTMLEERDEAWVEELRRQWARIGLDPRYHLEMDEPADSPYDVYRPEDAPEGGGKPPILILDSRGRLTEISAKSDIIRSIAGIRRGNFFLYYPEELVRPHADRLPPEFRRRLGL